jgi:serine protease Do
VEKLRAGDVIIELNGKPVASVSALRDLLADIGDGRVVRLLVQRREQTLYTTVRTK